MASLTIRNLDDDLKERLRVRVAQHGHSMEEEARAILRSAVGGATGAELWRQSRKLFSGSRGVDLAQPRRGRDRAAPASPTRMTGDCPRHECRVGSDEAFLMRASDNGWQIRPARPYGQQRLPAGRRRSGLEARFDALISPQGGLAVLAADRFAAQEAGLFRALRESNGLSATPSDMLIAGIVASSGGTMATRNTSDFTHLPITVVNPWQPP